MTNKPKRVGGASDKRTDKWRKDSDKGKGRKVFIKPPQKQRGPGRNR